MMAGILMKTMNLICGIQAQGNFTKIVEIDNRRRA